MNVKRVTTLIWNRLENYGVKINSQEESGEDTLLNFRLKKIDCKISLSQNSKPRISYSIGKYSLISFTDKLKNEKEIASDILNDIFNLVRMNKESSLRSRKKREKVFSLNRIGCA